MRTFECACGARVFFHNTRCLACGLELGFVSENLTLQALEPASDGNFETPLGRYRKCASYRDDGVCNWLVPVTEAEERCLACRLNRVIPDLSDQEIWKLWARVETAKRFLVYGLCRVGLPIVSKAEEPERGLAFDIKRDTPSERVMTGHSDGLITLNLAEADVVKREQTRVAMNERYRTLLGHFRHEVGHYYFDRLVADAGGETLERFRALFGDERRDYAQALEQHYAEDARPDFQESFISAYAAAHPWEDFAETFAHYLHMTDTLETAQHFGLLQTVSQRASLTRISNLDLLFREWTELTIAMNALNQSMGLPDAYPFAISPRVREKLGFVHDLAKGQAAGASASSAA